MTLSLYRVTIREERSGGSWTLFLRSDCPGNAQETALYELFEREGSGRYIALEPTIVEEEIA